MKRDRSLPKGGFSFDLCRRNAILQQQGAKLPKYGKTGTTIVGLIFKDGVILGADTRAIEGEIFCDKNCEKIHYLAPNISSVERVLRPISKMSQESPSEPTEEELVCELGRDGVLRMARQGQGALGDGAGGRWLRGYFVLTKASLSGGVDPFLFSTYRDGISCLTLFLYASFFEREHWPKMTLEVAGLILLMTIIGIYLQQTLFLFGLQFTNVTFSSIVMNCIPVWAFLIAVIFRLEEVSFDRRDGQAKVLGILFWASTDLQCFRKHSPKQ